MNLFPTLNTIYATFFGISPPTRACVAVDLPPSMRVKFDCFAYAEKDPSQRIALHVQGLSYWAPANIGPYSQAVLIGEHMFISGQIGLIPATISLPSPQDPATETALVFQHAERVADAVRKSSGQWKGHTQLAIYWLVHQEHAAGAAAACELTTTVGTIFKAVSSISPPFRKGIHRHYCWEYLLYPKAQRSKSKWFYTRDVTPSGTKKELRRFSSGSPRYRQVGGLLKMMYCAN